MNANGSSSGGSIIMNGMGNPTDSFSAVTTAAHGVFLNGSIVHTNNAGTININGQAGGTTSNANAVYVYNGSTISGVDGTITVNAYGATTTTGSGSGGLSLSSVGANIIQSTGLGNINIYGSGATNGTANDSGIIFNSAAGGILSATGNITLTGVAGSGTDKLWD